MTDDIVTRLRDVASLRGNIGGSVIPVVCTEAANEIERLRAELEYVRDVELGECRSEYTKISNKYDRLLKEQ